jgi:hypothetical protein
MTPAKDHNSDAAAKTWKEIRQRAREHAIAAIDSLAEIAANGESENARIAASNAILDRAYGKAQTTSAVEEDSVPSNIEVRFVEPGRAT